MLIRHGFTPTIVSLPEFRNTYASLDGFVFDELQKEKLLNAGIAFLNEKKLAETVMLKKRNNTFRVN